MDGKTIEIEADSLEDARAQLKSRVPEGYRVLSERVISDGLPLTVSAMSDTTEMAFAKAQKEIPSDAVILDRKELSAPDRQVITVEAFSEYEAQANARGKLLGRIMLIKSIRLVTPGAKGFLGIGKKPDLYEVEALHHAAVEITYRSKAKLSAELGKPEPGVSKAQALELTKLAELLTQARAWGERMRFPLLANYPQYKQIRQIGKKIHDRGGLEEMQRIYMLLAIRDPLPTKTLEGFWDGVGMWRR